MKSIGVAGRFVLFGKKLILPLGSRIAVFISDKLKYPVYSALYEKFI